MSYFAQLGPALRALRAGDAAHRAARPLSLSRRAHAAPAVGARRSTADDVARRATELLARLADTRIARAPRRRSRWPHACAPRSCPPSTEIAAAAAALDPRGSKPGPRGRAHARARRPRARASDRPLRAQAGRARRRGAGAARRARERARCPGASRKSGPMPGRRWPAGSARRALKRAVFDRLAAVGPFTTAPRTRGMIDKTGVTGSTAAARSASSASRPSAAAASSRPRSPLRSRARGHAVHVFSDEVPGRLDPTRANVTFHAVAPPPIHQLTHSLYTLALTSKIVEVSRPRPARRGARALRASPTPSAPTWRARCWPPSRRPRRRAQAGHHAARHRHHAWSAAIRASCRSRASRSLPATR